MDLQGFARKDASDDEEPDPRLSDAEFADLHQLANSCKRWFTILKYGTKQQEPMQLNWNINTFIDLYETKQLTKTTLCCGLSCNFIKRGLILPASFFR